MAGARLKTLFPARTVVYDCPICGYNLFKTAKSFRHHLCRLHGRWCDSIQEGVSFPHPGYVLRNARTDELRRFPRIIPFESWHAFPKDGEAFSRTVSALHHEELPKEGRDEDLSVVQTVNQLESYRKRTEKSLITSSENQKYQVFAFQVAQWQSLCALSYCLLHSERYYLYNSLTRKPFVTNLFNSSLWLECKSKPLSVLGAWDHKNFFTTIFFLSLLYIKWFLLYM